MLSTLFTSKFLAANCGNHQMPVYNKWLQLLFCEMQHIIPHSSYRNHLFLAYWGLHPGAHWEQLLECGLASGVQWGGWMTGSLQKTLTCTKMQLFPACSVAAEIMEQLFPGREVWNSVSKWNYSLRKRFLWGKTECNYPSWISARTVMFKTLPALVESATGPFNDCKGMGFGIYFFNFFFCLSISSKRQDNKMRKKKLSKKELIFAKCWNM